MSVLTHSAVQWSHSSEGSQWMKYLVSLVNKICGSSSQIYDMSVKSKPNYLVAQRGSGIHLNTLQCIMQHRQRFREFSYQTKCLEFKIVDTNIEMKGVECWCWYCLSDTAIRYHESEETEEGQHGCYVDIMYYELSLVVTIIYP